MISRTHLRQFLAVVDAGNFTRAALHINVSQPTLSAGIAELEKRLGTKLFARSNRRVQLTDAGNRLLAHGRAIEREFHLAEQSVTGLAPPARAIRLGVLATIATSFLEETLGAYAGSEPIEMSEGSERELSSALAAGRLDLALTLLRPSEARRTETLWREDYRLALPREHRLAAEAIVAAEDVAGETMIARRSCEVLTETSRHFTDRGVRPPFSFRSPNDDRALAMVRAGLGITVVPQSLGGDMLATPALAGFALSREIGLLYGLNWSDHHPEDHALLQAIRETTRRWHVAGKVAHP
jgi:DNA-binding transcriptional LysR family regulator